MFGSTLGIPLILSVDLCMADNPVDVGKLIGTEFFVSGLATMIQTSVGNRWVSFVTWRICDFGGFFIVGLVDAGRR